MIAARTRRFLWAAILIVAFGARLAVAIVWHQQTIDSGRQFRLGDSDSYWVLAGHIARGEPYQYGSRDASIFRAPLYPIVLAPWTVFPNSADGIFGARLMGCCFGTCAVALVMTLAGRLSRCALSAHEPDERTRGLANKNATVSPVADTCEDQICEGQLLVPVPWAQLTAGGLAALYPGAIGMSVVILSEAVFCPLMLLALLYWQRTLTAASFAQSARAGMISGFFSGLAILARPSWLLFLPLTAFVIMACHPGRPRQLAALAVMACSCALTMSPWWIRNALLTARFVPTTLQVGASLYDGLHPGASGSSDENMSFVDRFILEQRRRDAENGITEENRQSLLREHSSFEYRLNASMQREALSWAQKNLSGVFRLALVKFARTWSLWPTAGEVGSTLMRLALSVGCVTVLLLATCGSCLLHSQRASNCTWSVAICWSPAVYFTLLHMVFVGSIRYREPAMLVLTALAGCAAAWMAGRIRTTGDGQGSPIVETSGSG